MKNIVLFLFVVFVFSCGTYTKPKIASHVLAVTLEGDTILVAIDKIRPNMYNSFYPVYSNPYYNNYYPQNYNYQWRYNDNRGSNNSNNNFNSNIPKKVPIVPDIVKRPSSDVLMKNKK
tara:strand:+ start:1088 stop:1441 length:354 start_codon:yes stop_codon:yes gene_type:complete